MKFSSSRAREVWRCTSIWNKIEELLDTDRSGSVVLEEIIRRGGRLTSHDDFGFAELVLTVGWYIWWERRHKVHREKIQTPFRLAMSITVLYRN